MKDRLRELRKHLKLSQTAFAEKIGVSRSVVKNLELGVVEIKEHMIKLICSTFNINEDWLKTGDGDMFAVTQTSIIDELRNTYNLNDLDIAIVEGYLNLGEQERSIFRKYILDVSSRYNSNKRENIIANDIKAEEARIRNMSKVKSSK